MAAEKAEHIFNVMFGVESSATAQPASIFCLFGHSISTGTMTATQHNVYSSNPRCSRTTAFVELCTRSGCSYFSVISESTVRIGCC